MPEGTCEGDGQGSVSGSAMRMPKAEPKLPPDRR